MQRNLFILIALILALSSTVDAATPPRTPGPTRSPAAAASVLSIIPAQGAPGTSVTLYGSGFTDKTVAFLGNQEVPTTVLGPKQLSFEIPKLAPGLYALFLKREDGTTSKVYNFTIVPLKPVATSLSPDTVDMCSPGRDREVTVTGQNFQERSQVMFDGAAIRSRVLGETSIAFTVPQVLPGLHQVQVKNSEEAVSGALGLAINAKPEIASVTQGEEYVNYYNLVIEGRNFQQGSTIVVMEESSLEQAGGQYGVDTKRISASGGSYQREKAIYVNCNRMIYQRFPYSTVSKNLRIQILNPNGEESAIVSVSAP